MDDCVEECFPGITLNKNRMDRPTFYGPLADVFNNDSDDSEVDDFVDNIDEERIVVDGECLMHEAFASENWIPFKELKEAMKPLEDELTIFKEVVREGNGPSLSDKPSAKIVYQLFVDKQSQPFDTTFAADRGPVVMSLKDGIFPGFALCLASMRVFEVAKFLIPPWLAFGGAGVYMSVPPDAQIYAVIEVLAVCTEEEANACEDSEEFMGALRYKNAGNKAFKEARYEASIRSYKSALGLIKYSMDSTNVKELSEMELTIYRNLAIAYQKIGKPEKAIERCNWVLAKRPLDPKALFHLARSYRMNKQFERAKQTLEIGSSVLPNSKDFHDEYEKLDQAMRE